MPIDTSYVFIILLTIVASLAIGYAIYVKVKAQRYTRDRYAFAALTATISLATLGVTSITGSGHRKVVSTLAMLLGRPGVVESSSLSEKILLAILVAFAISKIHKAFIHWNGLITLEQYQKKKLHEDSSWIIEGLGEFNRLVQRRPPSEIYMPVDHRSWATALDPPVEKLAWRDQARELVALRWPSYSFDPDQGWHERASCWIGRDVKTGTTAGLLCTRGEPSQQNLDDFIRYIQGIKGSDLENMNIIVAIQQGGQKREDIVDGIKMLFETEESLLNDLVDFADYFIEIKKRAEVENLPDSDLTVSDVYVPSKLQIQKDDDTWEDTPEDLEEYLYSWTREPGQRQLALLGEYGQGKSTGALVFTYQVIKQSNERLERIPLLIELRGKSPSTLQPIEFFGAWASSYRIDPQALMKLLVAGRLLLIFEGFDEMADVADAEARRNHFRSLWRFCYPKAKILITGRPNLFLDDRELKAALGVEKSTATGPYCQALRLKPFESLQILESLRWATAEVRDQIVQLARQDENFRGVVSRPSLLYIVSRLWYSPELVARRTNMSSALVIGLFIQHSYKRQTEKHRDNRRFMVLTEAERSYFLDGIAAYMAANDLQNQIIQEQFDNAVTSLYRVIPNPEELSTGVSALRGEEVRPLNERLQDREDPLEAVKTDVRTYGILVQDFSRRNALRFPHKSFFEYLFANYVVRRLTGYGKVITSAIWTATDADPEKIIDMQESLSFAGELMSQSNGISISSLEKPALLNNLSNIIIRDAIPRVLRPFNRFIIIYTATKYATHIVNNAILNLFIRTLFRIPIFFTAYILFFVILILRIYLPSSFQPICCTGNTLYFFAFSLFMFVLLQYIIDRNLPRRRLCLWFMISLSLGVKRKDIQNLYGKLVAEGLPYLALRYDAGDALDKLHY